MSIAICVVAKFDVGDVRMTRGAADTLHQEDVFEALFATSTATGANCAKRTGMKTRTRSKIGTRLFSSYVDRNDNKFWIITEADRSATTILLPGEY